MKRMDQCRMRQKKKKKIENPQLVVIWFGRKTITIAMPVVYDWLISFANLISRRNEHLKAEKSQLYVLAISSISKY